MNYIEHVNCFCYIGSISLIYILNYTLNQNLTFLISVQYMFNLSFDVFEIPFIYAAFLSFRRFYLFNFKFKKHMFSSEIRLTLDNSVWETFSMQSNLQAFPRLFFPYYPVRWFIMWYETYHSVVLWQKISPLLTPFINNAVDLSVNFILLLFCSFVDHLYNLYRIDFIVRFISLDLQFYQQ